MADLTPLKPKPPRVPATPGSRPVTSADGNDLLLSSHRRNIQSKKASSVAETESTKNTLQAEVDTLKRQLQESEKRLSTPSKGAKRPTRDSVQEQYVQIQGERYNAEPYTPVTPRIMWEPFEDDPEVQEQLSRLRASENRIARRHESWEHEWQRAQRDLHSKIEAPHPAVFSARDDDAVLALAAKADAFAQTGRPTSEDNKAAPPNDDRPVQTSRMDQERRARTYSPAAVDRANSRSASAMQSNSRLGGHRRTSSIHPASAHVLMSFGLKEAVEIVLPDPEEVVSERAGDILGDQFVLKRDLFDAAFSRRDTTGVMGGAPGFRMIPRFNVGAVAQAHISGVKTILNEIAKQWDGPIVWVNLREEPIVYINNRSYIVRAAANPHEPLPTPGIKASRLERLEEKLREEILREGQRFGGNVIVHKESANRDIEAQWEAVEQDNVQTLRSVFDSVRSAGYDVRYLRLPVTPHHGISRHQLDVMFDVCERHPSDPIIVNCQTGRGRSTVAMVISTIVRFYQHALYSNTAGHTRHVSMLAREETASGFRKLAQLVSLLPNGHAHERRVSMMCELTGKASNLVERIQNALRTGITPAAVGLLSRYCQLVTFSAYCEARLQLKTTELSFSKWVSENPLVDRLLHSFESGEVVHELHDHAGSMSEAAQSQVAGERRGDILIRGMSLVVMRSASLVGQPIPGVDSLRQLHASVPIFTCGNATTAGRDALLYNACEVFQNAPRVDWIDVRCEPIVYLDGVAYFVSATKAIFSDHANQMIVTGDAIEDIERRLKADVLDELRAGEGVIEIFEADPRDRTATPRFIKPSQIQTPREFARSWNSCSKEIVYHRVPVVAGCTFSELSIHSLIGVAAESPTKAIVVIEDGSGSIKSTVAMNVVVLARLAQLQPLNSIVDGETVVNLLAVNDFAPPIATAQCYGGEEELELVRHGNFKKELMIAANLGQMLAAGGVLIATEAVCEVCGRGFEWNLIDRCNLLVTEMNQSVGESRLAAQRNALVAATMYLNVYLSAVYVNEVLKGKTADRFEDWCKTLIEIGLLIEKMKEHPKAGLKFVEEKNLFLDTDRGPVARRRGNVLTSNFGLKADHFPGAIRKDFRPQVHGVPNFRKVPHVNVYGVGIPTRRGITNLLSVLGAFEEPVFLGDASERDAEIVPTHPRPPLFHPDMDAVDPAPRGRVIWFNMREEPLLYVGDRPFVLRDLANPYVNVELTGITPDKIEAIETSLREDCLADAEKYNDQFLIHDEITPGVMGGLWEPGTSETISTIRSIYDDAVGRGARVTFVRLPVTDEQMPEIRDFDILIQSMLPDIVSAMNGGEDGALSLVFNCQMGRGRTTTGMVVGCMLIGLVEPAYYDKLRSSYPDLYPTTATKWENGFYGVINDLLRVLVDGKDSKYRLDLVLKTCDKMQNLRIAIADFKTKFEAAGASESARANAMHHGQHYLVRYFFLIVLNSYLHESWDPQTQRLRCTFVEYMEPRDELRHFSSRCDLK